MDMKRSVAETGMQSFVMCPRASNSRPRQESTRGRIGGERNVGRTSRNCSRLLTRGPWSQRSSSKRGDQVVVFVRIRARPKDSSAEIELRTGHLWTIRDGKVVSMRFFPKPKEALEAAGLSE
jgi:ketosteroid isomerase-like protein